MGIGGSQLLIIVVVLVLLFIAPSRLPGLGKSLAQAIKGFKKGISSDEEEELDVTNSVKQEKLDADKAAQATQTQTQKEKDKV